MLLKKKRNCHETVYDGNGVARVWAARGGSWVGRPQAHKNKYCIMNIPLLFLLLLCQSCRRLRNVSYGGRVLGLIESAYHGWLSTMTLSEGPFLVLPRAPGSPNLKPTTGYSLLWINCKSSRVPSFSTVNCTSATSCNCDVKIPFFFTAQQWRTSDATIIPIFIFRHLTALNLLYN